MSLLNILDAAELMKVGTLSIPMLSSFPDHDQTLYDHMITWTVDFAHTLQNTESLHTIRLVAPN